MCLPQLRPSPHQLLCPPAAPAPRHVSKNCGRSVSGGSKCQNLTHLPGQQVHKTLDFISHEPKLSAAEELFHTDVQRTQVWTYWNQYVFSYIFHVIGLFSQLLIQRPDRIQHWPQRRKMGMERKVYPNENKILNLRRWPPLQQEKNLRSWFLN